MISILILSLFSSFSVLMVIGLASIAKKQKAQIEFQAELIKLVGTRITVLERKLQQLFN